MIFVDMLSPWFFAALAAAYLLGALPSGLLVARLLRLPDPRTYGSGNVGATNMARSGSRPAAILTLFMDGGKGAAAVFAAGALAQAAGAAEHAAAAMAWAGVAAVLGHITSPFLKFRGGRGVATSLAVYLCWQPLLGLAALAVWGGVFALWRYSSAASLCAAAAATALFWLYAPPFLPAAAALNALIAVRHADNLRRLVAGREQRFGG